MNTNNVNSLIGQLNLGRIIADRTHDDFVHIPVEDISELVVCLEELKTLLLPVKEEKENG